VTIVPSSVRVRSLPDDGDWLIAVTRDVDPYPWWTWRTGGVGRGRDATWSASPSDSPRISVCCWPAPFRKLLLEKKCADSPAIVPRVHLCPRMFFLFGFLFLSFSFFLVFLFSFLFIFYSINLFLHFLCYMNYFSFLVLFHFFYVCFYLVFLQYLVDFFHVGMILWYCGANWLKLSGLFIAR